ncbi:DUF4352 domain-containing protein [Micromonospora sp. NPDC049559]|uniref:DUF4352 domain-containing protein n=1 Tax=Micromonospora sp. NPDC049559 TaxID=3155923 RepID=UPI003444DE2E
MRKMTIPALILAATVVLGCGAGTTGTSGSDDTTKGQSQGQDDKVGKNDDKQKPAETAKVGDKARDGKFEFVVRSSKCGVAKLGTDLLGERAQGQFCLVTVTVKNIGKESQLFSDSSQKAYDAKGTEFSTDTAAAIYANKNADTFLNDINPGNQVTGVLVFDIPKDVKLSKLELHDSPFSGGVTVTLS